MFRLAQFAIVRQRVKTALLFAILGRLVSITTANDTGCDQFINALGVGSINPGKLLLIAQNASNVWNVYEGNFSEKTLAFQRPETVKKKWPNLFGNQNFANLYNTLNVKAFTLHQNSSIEILFVVLKDTNTAIGVNYNLGQNIVSNLKLHLSLNQSKLTNNSIWASSSSPSEFYLLSGDSELTVAKMVLEGQDLLTVKESQALQICQAANSSQIWSKSPEAKCPNNSQPLTFGQFRSAFAYEDKFFMFTNNSMKYFEAKLIVEPGDTTLFSIEYKDLCLQIPTTITTTTATINTTTAKTPTATTKGTTNEVTRAKNGSSTFKSEHFSSFTPGNKSTKVQVTTEANDKLYIVIGSAVGGGLLVAIIAVLCCCCCCKSTKKEEKRPQCEADCHGTALAI